MDQATGNVQTGTPASWDAWDNYYKDASRRRRATGVGRNQLRDAKRKRRIRERAALAGSAVLLAGLMLLFYYVLSH